MEAASILAMTPVIGVVGDGVHHDQPLTRNIAGVSLATDVERSSGSQFRTYGKRADGL